ncbi:MAG TPA: hypothetical protein VGR32_02650 [Brevundimonas sp.]|jgi:hypothetical protein|uniref:hypothetical protein n=1 Tax=Brevundimonas sp. TaxID=1871086 RepID=UPI002DF4FE92|nr:hypothetical protein [Brevundimonas sp.]
MTDPILPRTQPDPEGDGQVISDVRAKSGRGGMHVLTILVVSATLVAIAFALIYMFTAGPMGRAEQRTEAAATSAESAQPLPERPTTTLPSDVQPRTPDPATSPTGA